ncbi:MAG: hypothetical protein IID32_03285 [Planctomycetes bacterium]|nr:hypothetical protein [Planctomycetota bacterium]
MGPGIPGHGQNRRQKIVEVNNGCREKVIVKTAVMNQAAKYLPSGVKSLAKRVLFKDRLWAYPALKKFGTIQDLYYWVADGNLDTLLILQNYFSAFYPQLATETEGSITLFSERGDILGKTQFALPHCGSAKFRATSLLADLQVSADHTFGTLEVNIAIPKDVLEHIKGQRALYFWDRFYIGYQNAQGQICFVHGVDKTNIYRDGDPRSISWSKAPENHEWAPETPINIDDYAKFTVIMINRANRNSDITLTLLDTKDEYLSWSAEIPPGGVHRFELSSENTSVLVPTELRMRIKGMPTQWGRPVAFKEFPNGAISAMHC